VELFNAVIVATNVLLTVNFAFNFVLYCVVNVHFRETWVNLLHCRLCRQRGYATPGRRTMYRGRSLEERRPSIQFYVSSRNRPVTGPNVCLHVSSPSQVADRRGRPHHTQRSAQLVRQQLMAERRRRSWKHSGAIG